MNGVTYKKPCALMVNVANDLPVFARVIDVYIINGDMPAALIQLYQTVGFNKQYHAFDLETTSECQIVELDHMHCPLPFHVRKTHSGTLAIVPKYHISGTFY